MYVCMYVCMHVCMYVCMCKGICIWNCVCVLKHVNTLERLRKFVGTSYGYISMCRRKKTHTYSLKTESHVKNMRLYGTYVCKSKLSQICNKTISIHENVHMCFTACEYLHMYIYTSNTRVCICACVQQKCAYIYIYATTCAIYRGLIVCKYLCINYMSVCLSVCLPACLLAWLAGCLSVCLSVCMRLCAFCMPAHEELHVCKKNVVGGNCFDIPMCSYARVRIWRYWPTDRYTFMHTHLFALLS